MESEPYTIKNYAQIKIHLKEYKDSKKLTQNTLVPAINTLVFICSSM